MRILAIIYCLFFLNASFLLSQNFYVENPQNPYFVNEQIKLKFLPDTFDFIDISAFDNLGNQYYFGRTFQNEDFSFDVPYVKDKTHNLVAERLNYSPAQILWHKQNAHPKEIRSVCFAAKDLALVTASENEVNFWDIANKNLIKTINLEQFGRIRYVLPIGATADTLFVGTTDGIYMFDVNNLVKQDIGQGLLNGNVRRIAHHPNKRMIAFGADSGFVGVFDYSKFNFISQYKLGNINDGNEIYSILFSPTGDTLLAGAYNGSLYLIDQKTSKIEKFGSHGINNQNTVVFDVAFSASLPYAVSVSADGTVRIWSLSELSQYKVCDYHKSHVRSLVLDNTGKMIVSVSLDSNINFVDLQTGILFDNIKYQSQLLHLNISADGKTFAVAGRDGSFLLFRLPYASTKSDTISIDCGYKFNISLSNIYAKFGEKLLAEINVDHTYKPEKMPYDRYYIELSGNYPKDLLYWAGEVIPGKLKYSTSGNVYFGISDKLNFLALGAMSGSARISLDTVACTSPDFYYFYGDSSKVEISSRCIFSNEQKIITESSPSIKANYNNNLLILKLYLVENGDYNLKIYDVSGRQITSETIDLTNGYSQILRKIDLSSGIYFVNLISSSGYVLNTKFIVEN